MEECTSTLADARKSAEKPMSNWEKRTVFLRVARAVQMLHSAGIVHNAICMSNVFKCCSGYKLGNYSALQRHGEKLSETTIQQGLHCPEQKKRFEEGSRLVCDFAADVWHLGML